MKIYRVSRDGENVGYDEFDSIVVKARNEENALGLAIGLCRNFEESDVVVEEIHLDDTEEIILESFNAG